MRIDNEARPCGSDTDEETLPYAAELMKADKSLVRCSVTECRFSSHAAEPRKQSNRRSICSDTVYGYASRVAKEAMRIDNDACCAAVAQMERLCETQRNP